jgi:phosphoglucosamine mutase
MADRHWFGTDGVRGVANERLSPELALKLASGAAQVLAAGSAQRPVALIGKDTRQSGDMLESALAAGFAAMGWDVELLGVVPTPAVAWLTQQRGAQLGAMISASHNPAPDNGIKFFDHTGHKLPDAIEAAIEAAMDQTPSRQTGSGVGRIRTLPAAACQPYLDHLQQSDLSDLKPLRIAVDLAHGAMVELAPALFDRLGLQAHYLHQEPDGMNINHDCGSTHLEALQAYVRENHLDLGVAFDGDGDRCLAVGPAGQLIDGDQMLYLCRRYLPVLQHEGTVVATVMSNLGLEQALKALDCRLLRTAVGDRYVLEAMQAGQHALGGEQSGHLIFAPYQSTGDGLLSALQLMNAVVRSGKSLAELLAEMPQYPQLLKNVVVSAHWQQHWPEHAGLQAAAQAASARLADQGRLLLRASGTEPKLRVMAEGADAQLVTAVVNELCDLIAAEMV